MHTCLSTFIILGLANMSSNEQLFTNYVAGGRDICTTVSHKIMYIPPGPQVTYSECMHSLLCSCFFSPNKACFQSRSDIQSSKLPRSMNKTDDDQIAYLQVYHAVHMQYNICLIVSRRFFTISRMETKIHYSNSRCLQEENHPMITTEAIPSVSIR